MFELAVLVSALFALVAAVFGWQLTVVRNAIALLFLVYGLSSFPYPKRDRWKITLSLGCVCFIVAGSLVIMTRDWWPLPLGYVLGMSVGSVALTKLLFRVNPIEVDLVISELARWREHYQLAENLSDQEALSRACEHVKRSLVSQEIRNFDGNPMTQSHASRLVEFARKRLM